MRAGPAVCGLPPVPPPGWKYWGSRRRQSLCPMYAHVLHKRDYTAMMTGERDEPFNPPSHVRKVVRNPAVLEGNGWFRHRTNTCQHLSTVTN